MVTKAAVPLSAAVTCFLLVVLYNMAGHGLRSVPSQLVVQYAQSGHPNGTTKTVTFGSEDVLQPKMSGVGVPKSTSKSLAGIDFLPEHLQQADQYNDELVEYIRDHWVFPPSSQPLKLLNHTKIHYSQSGQSEWIDAVLGQKTNGYFIECGAADGESLSNSLFFERQRNWTGILIEANPDFFQTLLSKNRHAFKVNACLSPLRTPVVLNFSMAAIMSGMTEYRTKDLPGIPISSVISVQCLPLVSIMRATGIMKVDYFSLDVEGAELDILKTIPLDELDIGLFGIETFLLVDDSKYTQTIAKVAAVSEMLGEYNYTKLSPPFIIDTMMQKTVQKSE